MTYKETHVDTADDELIGQVRLQALRRFLEIHRSPDDKDKLSALAQWLEQCPTHRQAFRELGQALAKVAEDPDVLEQVHVVAADGARVPLTAFASYRHGLVNDRVFPDGLFAAVGIGFSLSPGVSLEQGLAAIDAQGAIAPARAALEDRLRGPMPLPMCRICRRRIC